MPDESQSNNRPSARHLRSLEVKLVEGMLTASGSSVSLRVPLSSALVEDMNDGGMGSILFLSERDQLCRSAHEIARGEYVDEDGVLVIIGVNIDQNGELFELDFWKVDFSPLRRYPTASDIKVDTAPC
jgi:hypothetical protein